MRTRRSGRQHRANDSKDTQRGERKDAVFTKDESAMAKRKRRRKEEEEGESGES